MINITIEALVLAMLIVGGAIIIIGKVIEKMYRRNEYLDFFVWVGIVVAIGGALIFIARLIWFLTKYINTILIAL